MLHLRQPTAARVTLAGQAWQVLIDTAPKPTGVIPMSDRPTHRPSTRQSMPGAVLPTPP